MAKKKTPETVVAQKMASLVNDYALDLELVGKHIGHGAHSTLYNRLEVVFESAKEQRLNQYSDDYHEFLIKRIGFEQ